MVDKITSWKYAEELVDESDAMMRARARAEELGIECITAATGAHLAMLVSALGAKAIVEAGTGSGLSGLWLLSGNDKCVLATIDSESEHQVAAKASFKDAGIDASRTRVILGKATDVLSNMADAAYDLVLLDADRESLEQQIREATRLLRPGGVLAIAHALWRDRVPDPALRDDVTSSFRDAIRALTNNNDYAAALSTVGDGLLLASRR